ncbi:MAG TPA: SRPBCC family protein [Asticcacaulis sp.]|nr:SRPBCC family protein [Asticcacaulis sp.]
MAESRYTYVTFIRTTPEKLWDALTTTEFMKSWFFGVTFDTDWKQGAAWKMILPDGTLCNSGEILEFNPPSRLVLSWRHDMGEERKAEGASQVVWDIEVVGQACKLTLTQTIGVADSKVIASGAEFWPQILSNLKSVIETGQPTL